MQLFALTVAPLVALAISLPGPTLAQVASCEELRKAVESKIRSRGVSEFAIQVVEAKSNAEGQAVGACDRGAKKLLYVKAAGPKLSVGTTEGSKTGTKPKLPPVITECADGRVITSGNCRQQ
jgi:hypothetical protein